MSAESKASHSPDVVGNVTPSYSSTSVDGSSSVGTETDGEELEREAAREAEQEQVVRRKIQAAVAKGRRAAGIHPDATHPRAQPVARCVMGGGPPAWTSSQFLAAARQGDHIVPSTTSAMDNDDDDDPLLRAPSAERERPIVAPVGGMSLTFEAWGRVRSRGEGQDATNGSPWEAEAARARALGQPTPLNATLATTFQDILRSASTKDTSSKKRQK